MRENESGADDEVEMSRFDNEGAPRAIDLQATTRAGMNCGHLCGILRFCWDAQADGEALEGCAGGVRGQEGWLYVRAKWR